MPYRIRPDREFTAEFRKAAKGQLHHAITTIEEKPDGPHEAIHDVRKNLKRVRSLYRLVSREIPKFQERENARLRDIAKTISAVRDAAALVETATYLKSSAHDDEEAEALCRIITILEERRDRMIDAESGMDEQCAQVIAALEAAEAAIDDVTFPHGRRNAARLISKGWRNTLSKAQKAMHACQKRCCTEAFHTLRKRAQDYRAYHLLLALVWPSAMAAKYDAISDLVDVLGRVHDLDVLCDLVEQEPRLFENSDDLAWLLAAIIFRQQVDRHTALDLAADVLADPPREEARRIKTLWLALSRP